MSTTTRYYVANLQILRGDIESNEVIRFALPSRKKAHVHLNRVAASWYCDKPRAEDGAYWYFCDSVCVTPERAQEVSPSTYAELVNVVVDLSNI